MARVTFSILRWVSFDSAQITDQVGLFRLCKIKRNSRLNMRCLLFLITQYNILQDERKELSTVQGDIFGKSY